MNPNLCGKWVLLSLNDDIYATKIKSDDGISSEGHCALTEISALFPYTLRDSYWFPVGEDGIVKDRHFAGRQLSPELFISREDFDSIEFPIHLVNKESYVIVEFLPSGNYIIN